MIRISSEAQLLETFRPIDRDQVVLPFGLKFPFLIKDTMSWIEPSGYRAYLVFGEEFTIEARGIVFERAKVSDEQPASMCQWCHSVRGRGGVTLLTARASRDRRVGLHLCADLKCRENILGTPGVHDMNESVSRKERVQRVLHRMTEFARRQLF